MHPRKKILATPMGVGATNSTLQRNCIAFVTVLRVSYVLTTFNKDNDDVDDNDDGDEEVSGLLIGGQSQVLGHAGYVPGLGLSID